MATATTIDRAWIASQFTKGIDAERSLAAGARARAESPPDAVMVVLYNEIAAADDRHAGVVETIAVRYGHTPSRTTGGGLGEALGSLRDRVSEMGATPLDRLTRDLAAKADSVHWHTAWVSAFAALGDAESSRELAAVLAEERAHLEALQASLNRMVERGARGVAEPTK